MELRDLRYFCMAAELQHISKAAEKLGISQPFLTKVIKQLETELGTPLFEPSGRGIALNSYGELVYERAKNILSRVDGLFEEVDELLGETDRAIGLVSDTGGYTPDLALAYKRAFPHNMISIGYGFRADIIEMLNAGRADFALCTPPLTEAESKYIETEVVFSEKSCIVLPPESPLLQKDIVTFDDLRGVPLVTSPRGAGVRNNLELIFHKYAYTPDIVCESNDVELLLRSVMGGLGFCFMPALMARDPRVGPYCRQIELDYRAEIALSWNKNISGRPATEEFLGFVRRFFAGL